jgi:5'-methylthioadenosine phosphorylase/purine-nucleoside phosphorylase
MPIHLRAEPGDYATAVLCPGDPRRAAYIAATCFDPGWRQVNEERGMLGFTGTFDGRPISVQSTGMGCPSAGIVFEELIQLGATRLIRVGTCGGLPGRGVRLADTVIAMSATCADETPLRYADVPGFAATATYGLVERAAQLVRAGGTTVHVGPVVTSGIFYDPDLTNVPRWERLGHLGLEMEAGMLYAVAAVKGIEALAMMTVSDILGTTEDERQRITDEQLREGVDDMIRVACQVATS